jgi:4-diphosphocytidyl-2-C-methyl-D-erythritol kinase
VSAFAAAKINIGWHVGDLRPDGYHDVCGLIQTMSLVDRLDVFAGDDPNGGVVVDDDLPLRLRIRDAPELETRDNLVVAAARALAEEREPKPVSIRIEKVIPVGAGLGGGSADAAAALAALNLVWGTGLDPGRLIELGARIGSDVPAIFAGGLVHVVGRGELVRCIGSATSGAFVLGIGGEVISTGEAYAKLDEIGPATGHAALHHNDLEAAACALVPGLDGRLDAMRAAGAAPVFVSGSGPTVVGVAPTEKRAHEVAERVGREFVRVEVVTPTAWGVRVHIGSAESAF